MIGSDQLDVIPWEQIWNIFTTYGIVGVLAFLFIVIAYQKIMQQEGDSKIKDFLTTRKTKKRKEEDQVLKALNRIDEKLGVFNQILTVTNQNLNEGIRDIMLIVQNTEISPAEKERLIAALQRIENMIREIT